MILHIFFLEEAGAPAWGGGTGTVNGQADGSVRHSEAVTRHTTALPEKPAYILWISSI